MKNQFRMPRLFLVAAVALGVLLGSGCPPIPEQAAPLTYSGQRQNVVLMIGDGMGFNHLKAAEAFYGKLFVTTATVAAKGEVTTHSLTPLLPTDSAAAATALATGHKTKNHQVGQYKSETFQNSAELAKALKMAAGIIVTEGVEGATPAGFSAHTSDRKNADEILSDQLKSNIDLFVGSNRTRYFPLKNEIEKTHTFIDTFSSESWNREKIFAAFEEIPLNANGDSKPTLSSLCIKALEKLSQNPNGFFLMVEESHIDKFSHKNQLSDALEHVKAYDNAIRAVVEKAAEIGNTIVIVTADHETGGLRYDGETKEMLSDKMYSRTTHSTANVPYFVFGEITDTKFPSIIDNTQIGIFTHTVLSAE